MEVFSRERERGRVTKRGTIWERMRVRVGVVMVAEGGEGKWVRVREGGRMDGFLDCLHWVC